MQALRQALDDASNTYLVDRFGQLARATLTDQRHILAVGRHHRFGRIECLLFAATHDGQLAIDRTGLAAADRRIQKARALHTAALIQFARKIR